MDARVTMTGQGGWPMTVFLTPDGRPFYAGTYFPPEPRHGLPCFRQLLQAVAEAWRDRRDDLEAQAERLVGRARRRRAARAGDEPLTASLLDAAERGIARDVRARVRRLRDGTEVPARLDARVPPAPRRRRGARDGATTLDGMAAGGMYDVVGGGFHRYSVDERWLVPHFEKMLYDNALLASAYLHAWVVTGEQRYRDDRRGDARLRAPRAAAARAAASRRRRTPTRTASRG